MTTLSACASARTRANWPQGSGKIGVVRFERRLLLAGQPKLRACSLVQLRFFNQARSASSEA
jgi:hypothetical protein